jgi:hypothetical protein
MSNSCEFLTTNLITDYEKDGKTSSQSIVLIERAKQAPKFIKGLFPQAKESVEREPPVTSSPGTAVEQTQAILPNSDVFHPVPATETAPDTTEPTSTALGEADGSTQAIETQTDIVVKTSNSTEKIWDRLFASATELFNECFDESFNKLLSSTNLSEVVDAFKIAEFNIGRSEFVTAIMLYKIHEKKIWATIGYTSLSGFLRDLPDSCKLSRQGFYNAVNSGYVLHNFQFFSNSEKNRGFLSLDMLKSNYSKLHLLFPIVKNKQMDRAIIRMKDDIVDHFLNDSYDAFKNYLNQVSNKKPRPQNIIRTDCVKTVKSVPATLDALDGVRKEIYDAIQNERIVAVLSGATPSVVASVKQYIEARRQREIATANEKFPDARNLFMKCEDGSKKPVIDCDVSSEFIKDWPKLNIEILGGLPDQLSPQDNMKCLKDNIS